MDLNKLMEQAQALQNKMQNMNQEIEDGEYYGSASNGLVKVTINGKYKIKNIEINQDIINKEDKEMIEDLVMIAVNEASEKLDQIKKEKLGSLTGGMNIPGL